MFITREEKKTRKAQIKEDKKICSYIIRRDGTLFFFKLTSRSPASPTTLTLRPTLITLTLLIVLLSRPKTQ